MATKQILVISDSHGNKKLINEIIESNNFDMIIHLGDGYSDMYDQSFSLGPKLIQVMGNCDISYPRIDESIITVGKVSIFLTHGHLYNVKSGRDMLSYKASQEDCKVALYGHTHKALAEEIGGVLVINPGNLQKYSSSNTYCVLEINDNGEITYKFNNL